MLIAMTFHATEYRWTLKERVKEDMETREKSIYQSHLKKQYQLKSTSRMIKMSLRIQMSINLGINNKVTREINSKEWINLHTHRAMRVVSCPILNKKAVIGHSNNLNARNKRWCRNIKTTLFRNKIGCRVLCLYYLKNWWIKLWVTLKASHKSVLVLIIHLLPFIPVKNNSEMKGYPEWTISRTSVRQTWVLWWLLKMTITHREI